MRAVTDKLEKEKKVSQLQVLEFFTQCQTFLKALVKKMIERCPLKYSVARYLSSLSPTFIANHPESAADKFGKLLGKLLSLKRLRATECDTVKHEYDSLLKDIHKYHKDEFKNYTQREGLDKLYLRIIGENDKYCQLWKVVKLVLLLFHGQSAVERGFSANKDILTCNMGEDTVHAYRIVYDGLKKMECEAHEVPVGKEMLQSCRFARQRYNMLLEDQKKKKKDDEAEERKKRQKSEVLECKKKEKRLEAEASSLLEKADKLCEEAEKSHKWNLLNEANALRTKGKQKRKDVEEAKKETEIAEKKLKLV